MSGSPGVQANRFCLERMMGKVVLILSDALRYDVAVANMGFLGHLVESRQASLYKIVGELPSLSRPMYETIHTGLPSSEHGIVSNSVVRLSDRPNIFRSTKEAGKTTAAAAYFWYSELYNRVPYNAIDDKEVDDTALNIQHGRFYTEDDYPDIELFNSAAHLIRKFSPDYLLLHPMGMDYYGETFGSDTKQYRSHATYQDLKLAPLIMEWRERGYVILVTGDHGINADGVHGGTTPEQREVPFFVIPAKGQGRGDTGEIISHLQIAPSILKLLDVPIPSTMKHGSLSLD
ncbi:MAG TPA: nucleotide pyrophosphatase [Anaerolineae bacterium]|nr:nucleotide pyrophosphatase [Anaerolineae bacterium]HRJ56157.1 alkaline phosphatase family protein [Anaerolineales bacterium]